MTLADDGKVGEGKCKLTLFEGFSDEDSWFLCLFLDRNGAGTNILKSDFDILAVCTKFFKDQ